MNELHNEYVKDDHFEEEDEDEEPTAQKGTTCPTQPQRTTTTQSTRNYSFR